MKKSNFLLYCFSLLTTAQLFGAEVDQFTRSEEFIQDSSAIINSRANDYLKIAIAETNKTKNSCDEKALYKEIRKYYANHTKGILTKFILNSSEVDKRIIQLNESIFSNWTAWDGLILGSPLFNRSGLALSPIIKFGDQEIGVDKFEHMFGRGFRYFTKHYLKNKSLEYAVKQGIAEEKLLYGGNKIATGVFSYADLSANFNGMRFWNHMLQKSPDLLGQNLGPYISCIDNKFVQVKEIDFKNYFDSSMDERINCSKFPTKKTMDKYLKNVHSLTGEQCPIDSEKRDRMVEKYGPYSHWIINQVGVQKVDYFNEFSK